MENPLQSLIDAVAELQAQALGNGTMIEALLMSHPDPGRLRDCWQRLSAARIAATSTEVVARGRTVDHASVWHLNNWTEKLDRHHPPTP